MDKVKIIQSIFFFFILILIIGLIQSALMAEENNFGNQAPDNQQQNGHKTGWDGSHSVVYWIAKILRLISLLRRAFQ